MSTDPFQQFINLVGTLRANVEPAMRQLEDVALKENGMPRDAQLQLVKATRAVIRPLLDAFRGLVEPVATADMKLSALEKQLERRV